MNASRTWFVFIALLGAAALVIFISGQALPETVASHFSGSGEANGQMARATYLELMIGIAAGLPLAIAVLLSLLLDSGLPINVPNRVYWLAPARKAATFGFLRLQTMCFGVILAAFLCFVHLCIVDAHKVMPPRLSSHTFTFGLGVYLFATVIWSIAFLLRFKR